MTLLFLEHMAYQDHSEVGEKARIRQSFETCEDAVERTSNTYLKIMILKIVTFLVLMMPV